jgi:hypothetical protein
VTSRNRGTPNYNTLCSVRGIYCTAIWHSNCVPVVKFMDWCNDSLHEMGRQKCRGWLAGRNDRMFSTAK